MIADEAWRRARACVRAWCSAKQRVGGGASHAAPARFGRSGGRRKGQRITISRSQRRASERRAGPASWSDQHNERRAAAAAKVLAT